MQSRRTREGSRFVQLAQQVAVPSWMHGTVARSAYRASAPGHASFHVDVASDVLSQIAASMDAPQHTSARAVPAKGSAAEDILSMLEANLQPPSPQHLLPAVAEGPSQQLAADDVREIDKLFLTPALSRVAAMQHHEIPNVSDSSESAMQQLPPWHATDGNGSAVQMQPMAVYAHDSYNTAWWPMQQDPEWSMDITTLGEAQDNLSGNLRADHRYVHAVQSQGQKMLVLGRCHYGAFWAVRRLCCLASVFSSFLLNLRIGCVCRHQHIKALLQRTLLEPASLRELRAAWSSRPVFEPHLSTLRSVHR